MKKLVWELPLSAKFEFEKLSDGKWKAVHYDEDQSKIFEQVFPDVLPALAFAANIVIRAYVICGIEQDGVTVDRVEEIH